jgi:serine protease Do
VAAEKAVVALFEKLPGNTETKIMTQRESSNPVSRRGLAPRRLAMLASVAGIGLAVLIAGPGPYRLTPGAWTSTAQAADAAPQMPSFADLVAKVKPAVISVRVKYDEATLTPSASQNGEQFKSNSPFDQFFGQFNFRNMPNGMPQFRQNVVAEGSGFFISSDGYAVTNNHVVGNAKTVQITTNDGRTLQGKVVGRDQLTDLALIKVDGQNFPFVKFAGHQARVGDWVVAVGNPYGLGGTVTAGIVSANGRDIGSGPYEDFIQIDAPINKGNSGGPTFDLNGNVIGVNTAIYSPSGGSVGIGFDIPASTAEMVINQLKDKGHVTRGWMGVQVQPVTAGIADSLGMKNTEGAIVDEPQSGSPAARAGIKAGDVITSVNGTAVKDSSDLARKIAGIAPGSSVKLGMWRNGAETDVTLTLGELPGEHQVRASNEEGRPTSSTPELGLTLAPANEVEGAGSRGVAVTDVNPQGPAAEKGIQAGDVILDVGGKAVSRPADVRKELSDLSKAGKHNVLMRMKSGDTTKFVAVPLGNA